MSTPTQFIAATPVLASLDIERSAEFFSSKLGFTKVHVAQGAYGIVVNGPVYIHFWACTDRHIAEATGCRVQVQGIEGLHTQCASHAIVHPNAPLAIKPWGTKEFAILDPDGNLVTFYESTDAQPFHRADAQRHATHGPHFILGHARPAAARRSCQTLEVYSMKHLLLVAVIALVCCVPLRAISGERGSIEGQSETFRITINDDSWFNEDTVLEIYESNGPNDYTYSKLRVSVKFLQECRETPSELICRRGGKTILAGVTYRKTLDETPHCPFTEADYRYTCAEGCTKHVPRYLAIYMYEGGC